MAYRVIQWATGGVGRAAIEGILSHPDLELVGVWVHSEAKNGKDVGELIGRDPIGIRATNDVDTLLALDADCIHYSPLLGDPSMVARMLEAGKNVVTPLGWFYRGERDWTDLDEACEKGNATLHGTGIHPGGVTERLPLVISALSNAVTYVRAEEWSDMRTYDSPGVLSFLGFGKKPEDALRPSGPPPPSEDMFIQSIDMVADAMGFDADPERRFTHEVCAARQPIDSPIGVIEPGLVAGQRFTWEVLVRGEPVVMARTNWLMGDDGLDEDWTFGDRGPRYEVEIEGDPPSLTVLKGWNAEDIEAGRERNSGIVATAVNAINAIPSVCAADAGIKSYLDLPFATAKAAPHLAKKR